MDVQSTQALMNVVMASKLKKFDLTGAVINIDKVGEDDLPCFRVSLHTEDGRIYREKLLAYDDRGRSRKLIHFEKAILRLIKRASEEATTCDCGDERTFKQLQEVLDLCYQWHRDEAGLSGASLKVIPTLGTGSEVVIVLEGNGRRWGSEPFSIDGTETSVMRRADKEVEELIRKATALTTKAESGDGNEGKEIIQWVPGTDRFSLPVDDLMTLIALAIPEAGE
ncbi:MAG: hypothetical protein JST59_23755 [Actinobacteria bacterium]|nr:hypothetical protein [Actinomycetota bacterium]